MTSVWKWLLVWLSIPRLFWFSLSGCRNHRCIWDTLLGWEKVWVSICFQSPYVLTSHPTNLILAVVISTCHVPRGPAPQLAHSGQSQAKICLSDRVFTGLSGGDVLTCPYKWVCLLNTESINRLKRKNIVCVTNGWMVWLSQLSLLEMGAFATFIQSTFCRREKHLREKMSFHKRLVLFLLLIEIIQLMMFIRLCLQELNKRYGHHKRLY